MNKGLQRYLNDHLANSEGALALTDQLIERNKGTSGCGFLKGLRRAIEQDISTLTDLIEKAGLKESSLSRFASKLTGGTSRLKLRLEPSLASDFEALEMLALSIHAKRLLWRMLDDLSPRISEWAAFDFIQLEKDAKLLRDGIETVRIKSGKEHLVTQASATSIVHDANIPEDSAITHP